jgi:hypothetical protein
LSSSHVAAEIKRGSLRGTPASASARTASPVSHTGEMHGCTRYAPFAVTVNASIADQPRTTTGSFAS